jgi:glycosyltransferase involved in cell wall biosynthesis
MMAEATRILTVSEFTKSRLINILNAPSDKISVIGNGVDEEFYRAGAAWIDCDRTDPSVVVVGGLRGKKGAGAVLSTAKILSSMNSPIHIDVIGQHESEWNARAAPHANVRLYGHLPTGKVAQMLAKSVALLFLSPYEGFGIPALEAMAAGAPAVVAARASLPEVVANAGILIDPDDAEDVARILERLRQEQEWRDSWVQAGKIHAAAFTWQACVSRLLVVLGASHLLQKP